MLKKNEFAIHLLKSGKREKQKCSAFKRQKQ